MSNWLVHSSGPWKNHKYKSRTGTPGNYKYIYVHKGVSKGVEEVNEKKKHDQEVTDRILGDGYNDAATNRAASQRTQAQQAGKEWQETQQRKRKAAKQQAADERAYKERWKETFNLPTSGKSRAQRAQNNAASKRLAAQQSGKDWQEKQAKKSKEAARKREMDSALRAENKRRGNDAASKARKASEKRKSNDRAMEQDRIRHIESIKKRDRKTAVENVVRSFTKKKKKSH